MAWRETAFDAKAARALSLALVFLLSSLAPYIVQLDWSQPVLEHRQAVFRSDTLVTLIDGNCTAADGDCDGDLVANDVEDINNNGNYTDDDTDGDGTPDYQDTDDDGDGWPTWFECPDGANSTENHCPGIGLTYDYLNDSLFNCDQPLVTLDSGSNQMDVYAYFWTNGSLVRLAQDLNAYASGVTRSAEDGKLWWVDETRETNGNKNVYSWTMNDGLTRVGDTNYYAPVDATFSDENGTVYAYDGYDAYPLNRTNGQQGSATVLGSISSIGDIAAHPNNGTYYIFQSGTGGMLTSPSSLGTPTSHGNLDSFFGNDYAYEGATILSNGTLLTNDGTNIYIFTGDWANGSGTDALLKEGATGTEGDMATCAPAHTDSDSDGLEDFYETEVFSTSASTNDTDADDLDDYAELSNGTSPLNPDTDDDGLFDGHELLVGADPLAEEDADDDGTPDWWDSDEDGDGILGTLECNPSNPDAYNLVNGGFESPDITANSDSQKAANSVPGWNTSETAQTIEIWDGDPGHGGPGYAYEGDQYAEINSQAVAALYQDFESTSGDIMVWTYQHAKRSGEVNKMFLKIDAVTATYSSNMDIIDYSNATNSLWNTNAGSYLVPAGQSNTRFAFEANGGGSAANLVDGINFRPVCTLDTDGDGINNNIDTDSDNDGIDDANESTTLDWDGDGQLNFLDWDSDGDGIADGVDPDSEYGGPNVAVSGLEFDGTNDYVVFPDDSALEPTGHFTVELWAYSEDWSPGNNYFLFDLGGGNTNGYRMYYISSQDKIKVKIEDDYLEVNANILTDSTWHHFALNYDQQKLRFIIDGKERASLTRTEATNYDSGDRLFLGCESTGTACNSNYFEGIMDEFKVWNYSRNLAHTRRGMHLPSSADEGGLLAYLDFNDVDGSTVSDLSSNNVDATVAGATNRTSQAPLSAKDGPSRALSFDGTDDHVNFGKSEAIGTSDFTVEAWVRTSMTSDGVIIQSRQNGSTDGQWTLRIGDGASHIGKVNFWDHSGSAYGFQCRSTSTINDDLWHHIAFRRSGTDGQIFIDGVADLATVCDGGSSAVSYASLDYALGYDRRDNNEHFDGEMDEVRVWSEARTQNEIRAYMFRPLLGQEPNLVSYYPLDNPRHDTVHDMSLNHRHGTFNGMPGGATTLTSTAPLPKATGAGSAIGMDGEEDWVRIDWDTNLNPSTVTFEAWIHYEAAPSSEEAIVSSRSRYNGNTNGYALYTQTNMSLNFTFGHSSGTQSLISPPLSTGSWHHVAVTHQNGNSRIYLNGSLVATEDTSYSMVVNPGQPVRLGVSDNYTGGTWNAPDGRYFSGEMDEVRFWSDVRTQDEIFEHRNAILHGWENGLIGYYRMNEANGTTVFDHSSKANHGVLQNANETVYLTSDADIWNALVQGEALGLAGSSETETATLDDHDLLDITGDHAYTVWIKANPAGTNTRDTVFTKTDSVDGPIELNVWKNSSGKLVVSYHWDNDGSATYGNVQNTACAEETPVDEWIHIAMTGTSSWQRLYINGFLCGTATHTYDPGANTQDFIIGADDVGYDYEGRLDNLAIYNTTLSQQEVRDRMHRDLDGTEFGLVAYFPVIKTGDMLVDVGPHGLHGSMTSDLDESDDRIPTDVALADSRIDAYEEPVATFDSRQTTASPESEGVAISVSTELGLTEDIVIANSGQSGTTSTDVPSTPAYSMRFNRTWWLDSRDDVTPKFTVDMSDLGYSTFYASEFQLIHKNRSSDSWVATAASWSKNGDVLTIETNHTFHDAYFSFAYVQAPGNVTYSASSYVMTNGSSYTVAAPSFDGVLTGCVVSPALPSGMSLADNCSISGVPTLQSYPQTEHTITAMGPGGNATTTVDLEVLTSPNTITFDPTSRVGERDASFSDWSSTVGNDAAALVWEITPDLPTGLSLASGVINGLPTDNLTDATVFTVYANNSVGSAVTTITLTVNEPAPSLTMADVSETVDEEMTVASASNAGGAVEAWRLTPDLPDGLVFANGSISGTATENMSTTTFSMNASNSGGFSVVTFDITVLHSLPDLSALQTTITGTRDTAITNLTVSNAGGTVTEWSVSPPFPNGINLVNGLISGTPTVNQTTAVVHTVTGTNSGGSDTVDITVTISEPTPDLSTTATTLTLTNQSSVDWTATNTGGNANEWSYRAELDAYTARWKMNEGSGTNLFDESDNNNNGTISGASWTTGRFGGALAFDGIDDTVSVPNDESLNLTENFTIETWVWLNDSTTNPERGSNLYEGWIILDAEGSGWDGYMFGIEAAIPQDNSDEAWSRLTMLTEQQAADGNTCSAFQESGNGQSTGTVVGRSNVTKGQWNHVAVVYNSTVTGSEYLEFYINGELDVRYQCAFTFTPNNEIRSIGSEDGGQSYSSSNLAYWNGSIDELAVWQRTLNASEIAALASGNDFTELPDGLSFNSTTGQITGIPTDHTFPDTRYIITATNDGGESSVTVNIVVNDVIPSLSLDAQVFTRNVTITNVTVTNGGGEAVEWGISPAVPDGLTFESGVLSGTPSNNQTATTYTVYANNSGGQATATFDITVNEPVAGLSIDDQTFIRDQDIGSVVVTNTGGAIATWGIHPALPSNLVFENGSISGTPLNNQTSTTYTVFGNNTGGSTNTTFNITVNEPQASLSIGAQTFTVGTDIGTVIVSNAGGKVATWSITPALPDGLSFANGTLAGNPTENQTATSYTVYAENTGGNVSVSFTITINENTATLVLVDQVFTRGEDVGSVAVTNNGGSVQTWGIHPALPSNLQFSNGVITGTPSSNQSAISYTVFGNNTGGSVNVTFTITVNEPLADLTLADQVFTRGVDVGTVLVDNDGGFVQTWSIHPALPSNLVFANGTITGSSSANQTATTYTIYANNSGGSVNITVDITVNEPLADLTLADQTFTRGVDVGSVSVANAGGDVATWGIHPALPDNLAFANGTITGSPTANQTAVTYTIYANNTGGSTNITVDITVNEPLADLTLADQSYTRGDDVGTVVVTNDGGFVQTWGIHPALPDNLVFANGTITGTPTANQTATTYTIFANNSGGSTNITVDITINEPLADLTLADQTYTRDVDVGTVVVANAGGYVLTWAIHPALPDNLVFANGTITGTPTANQTAITYTIFANNSGGSTNITVDITVNEPLADLTLTDQTYTRDEDVGTVVVANAGGYVLTWAIHPALPDNLVFANGTITGSPAANQTATTYTIFANNSGGSTNITVDITVNEPLADLTLADQTFTRGVDVGTVVVANAGGYVQTWAIHPALPGNLVFANGTITGSANVNQTAITYTIFANNSGGSTNITVDITVNEDLADLVLGDQVFTRGVDVGSVLVTNNGGFVQTWGIHPALPSNLAFDNGTITGSPTANQTATSYTIFANNTGGSTNITVNITVNEPLADLTLADQTYTRGVDVGTVVVANAGGFVQTWSIHPALPDNLVFANGTITGTPSSNQTAITYTVFANNSGGSTNITVDITVNEPLADLTLADQTYTRGVDVGTVTVANAGGFVQTWGIHPALPDNLAFANGTITGSPSSNQTAVTYTIYANNTGGSTNITVDITVNEPLADLSLSDQTYTRGVDVGTVVVTNDGGFVQTWGIHPALPDNLVFANGTITGTPDANQTAVTYTVYANNSGGSTNITVDITINEPLADLTLADQTFTRDVDVGTVVIANAGGFVQTWGIHPALPDNLVFANGTITGSPNANQTAITYTIYANNTGGSTNITVDITVNEPLADLTLADQTFTRDVDVGTVVVANAGGFVQTWGIHPALPGNLVFENGTISGSPSANQTAVTYTIYANNTGGSTNITVDITVNEPLAALTLADQTFTRGLDVGTVVVANAGGFVATWGIHPALPSNLVFANGTISGIPSANQTAVTYTIFANNTGGSTNITMDITVNEPAASLTLSNQVFARGVDVGTVVVSNTGGFVQSWSIHPALPGNLVFANGTITGSPTDNQTATSYTVYANNSGGNVSVTFTITVNEEIPDLVLSDQTFTRNASVGTVLVTNNGGFVATWGIHPSLPDGLNFDNGTITGTPLNNQTAASYTVYANNSGGNTNISVNITINEPLASIALSHQTFTRGVDVGSVLVANTGGQVATWSIHPSLPSNLAFDNGTISGVPTANQTATSYTIFANNTGGSTNITVDITVNEPLADLTLADQTYTRGVDVGTVVVSNAGGVVLTWSIHPALPSSLVFANGTITGSADANQTAMTYTIFANNSGGSTNISVDITVNEPLADLTLADQTYTRGVDVGTVVVANAGGLVQTWGIHPALPSNLVFENGTITGTPNANQTAITYTVFANNSGGSTNITVDITVNEPLADLTLADQTYTRGEDVGAVVVANAGGFVQTWGIHPALPSNLVFVNGTITGTPNANQTATTYTIFANNTGGSTNITVDITVNEPLADLTLADQTYTRGVDVGTVVVANAGGFVQTWGIHPALPSNLIFANGTITGTPAANQSVTTYTIFANNSGGSTNITVDITVNEPLADLTLADQTFTRGLDVGTVVVANAGGFVATWAIHPALPGNLVFDNGTITGTPNANQTAITYTVFANNSGGSTNITVDITVNEPLADLSLADQTYTRGVDVGTVVVANAGGFVQTWSIHPALPSNLVFVNGTITGTPNANQTATTYTIFANNSGGSANIMVDITVNEPAASLTLSDQTFTRGVDVGTVSVDNNGGTVATWGIHPALPDNLAFANGSITGTPTSNQSAVMYTIYANSTGGSTNITVNITINEPLADLTLTDQTFTRGVDIGTVVVANAGGLVQTWGIHPALPSNLVFANGTITGSPNANQTAVTYTIFANNSGGSTNITVDITVNEPLADLTLIDQTYTRGVDVGTVVVTNAGGLVQAWGIHPSLPNSLVFANGTITGTPDANQTATTYTIFANNTGGSTSITVGITVNEPLADLTLADQTFTRGVDVGIVVVANTGGFVQTWGIHPALPSSLVFANGTITGSSDANQTAATYTVFANNTGGSTNITVDITVNEPLADLTLSDQTYTRGVDVGTVVVANAGGFVQTWGIHPALPSNLVFANGTITGSPDANQTALTYTIFANNTGGSTNITVDITVNEPLADLTLADQIFTRGVDVGSVTVANAGGFVQTWSIHPALPSNLVFANGTITGSPTVNQTGTTYTIFANNTGGSTNITVDITVNEPLADLSLSDQTYTRGVDVGSVVVTNAGGFVQTWSIHPTLPSSLVFANGTITGTPDANQTATTYTIFANNSGGSTNITVDITVNEPAASLTLSDQTFTRGVDVGTVSVNNNGGTVATWGIHPSLPDNLVFANGSITGTPTSNQTTVMYTIYANSTGGSTNITVNITVNEPLADLTLADQTYTRGLDVGTVVVSNAGGFVQTWGIHPTLPSNLVFENGTITGSSDTNQTATTYTIYANNSGGSTSITVNITINEPLADLTLADQTYTRGADVGTVVVANAGGFVQTWGIYPDLPSNLVFANGTITGSPDANQTTVTYTIFANNSGGSTNITVDITVNEPLADLSLADQTYTRGVDVGTVVVTNAGGFVQTWGIHPALPSNLVFDNGIITGTPDANQTAVTYTIFANNSGGSTNITVDITVDEPLANLSLSDQTYTRGVDVGTVVVANAGGYVQTWGIHPALPSNLVFDNGTITGNPLANQTAITYTIYANNSGGPTTITFNITVNEPVADLTLADQIYTRGVDVGAVVVANAGGLVETWSIHPSLPGNLMFANGTITGSPSANQTATTYTMYANNSGGSTSIEVQITINEPLADLSLADQTFTRGVDVGSVVVNNAGGVVQTWAIHPALPGSLVFTNGTITGIPDANQTTVTYTVFANNSGGSFSLSFNITVNEPLADLGLSDQTFVRGVDVGEVVVANAGGFVQTWGIHPALPSNLMFANGTITGSADGNQTSTAYTVFANNSGGSTNITFNLTVTEPLPVLQNMTDRVFTRGVNITELQFFSLPVLFTEGDEGGVVDEWGIAPALPTGLSFNNGVLSGTPQVNLTTTPFTVFANNSGGSVNQSFNITINEPLVILATVADQIFTRNSSIPTLMVATSVGVPETWGLSPALPAGLVFDNGTLSGTPLVNMTATLYTIYANNSGGSVNTTFSLTVNEPLVQLEQHPDRVFTRGLVAGPVITNFSEGTPASWGISPALPLGLTLVNGVLGGTPLVNSTRVQYTIYANNSGGSATVTINLTINEQAPNLAVLNNLTVIRSVSNGTHLSVVNSGGIVANWSVSPALPSGLQFNPFNGSISGVASVNHSGQVYTISASNTGGSDAQSFQLVVVEPLPVLSYLPSTYVGDVSLTISDMVPTNTGGAIAVWSIHPSLPLGITLNTTSGVISGTPTTTSPSTQYTVFANNSGGSSNVSVTLEITGSPPNLSGASSSITLVRQETMVPFTVQHTGSLILEWGVWPSLPVGLTFDVENATIYGVPLVNTSAVTHSIWARNAVANETFELTITVLEPAPIVTINVSSYTMTRGVEIVPIQPMNTGGAIANWSVNGTLPAGLVFNESTGQIVGTPLVNSSAQSYTVTGANLNNQSSIVIVITVNEPAPVLVSHLTHITGVVGTPLPGLTFNNTGGVVANWMFEQPLPAGLQFSPSNHTLYGTPNQPSTNRSYTLLATNSGGNDSILIHIRIIPPAPRLTAIDNTTLIAGTTVVNFTLENIGGPIDSLVVSPALPDGLVLNVTSLSVEGRPLVPMAATLYTLTASNEAGEGVLLVQIRVLPPAPALGPVPLVAGSVGSPLATIAFTNSGGPVQSWSFSPDLPDGLAFNLSNMTLYGIPTAMVPLGEWAFTGMNEAGESTVTLSIRIVDAPPHLVVSGQTLELRRGDLIDGYRVVNDGGTVTNWTVDPALPEGLFFNPTNGTLYGVPSSIEAPQVFNFTGTNTGGISTVQVTIVVLEPLPVFAYPTQMAFDVDNNSIVVEPTVADNSGIIVTYSIEPMLPSGLRLDPVSGIISGAANAALEPTQFVITARNEDGFSNQTVFISVVSDETDVLNDPWVIPVYAVCGPLLLLAIVLLGAVLWLNKPTFRYNRNVTVAMLGERMLPKETIDKEFSGEAHRLKPHQIGLHPVSPYKLERFAIEPELPHGLTLDENTGAINGAPAERIPSTKFTISAFEGKRKYRAVVAIEVRAPQNGDSDKD